mmetsp:Transcript_1103/g.2099  ORF Transcript_1103/g.2099 Transcript_1103/m.2099 type:complete len:502 (-) Transcript_1103:673-2178(-)
MSYTAGSVEQSYTPHDLCRIRLNDQNRTYIDIPIEVVNPDLLKEVFNIRKISFLRRNQNIFVYSGGRWIPNLTPGEYLLNQPLPVFVLPVSTSSDEISTPTLSRVRASVSSSSHQYSMSRKIAALDDSVHMGQQLTTTSLTSNQEQNLTIVSAENPAKRRKTIKDPTVPYRLYEDPTNEKERLWNLHAPEIFQHDPQDFKNEKAIRGEFKPWYENYHTIVGACNQIMEIQKRRIAIWNSVIKAGRKVKDLAIKIQHTEQELVSVEQRIDRVARYVEAVLSAEETKPADSRFTAKIMFFNRLRLDMEYARTLLAHARDELQKIPIPIEPVAIPVQLTAPDLLDESRAIQVQALPDGPSHSDQLQDFQDHHTFEDRIPIAVAQAESLPHGSQHHHHHHHHHCKALTTTASMTTITILTTTNITSTTVITTTNTTINTTTTTTSPSPPPPSPPLPPLPILSPPRPTLSPLVPSPRASPPIPFSPPPPSSPSSLSPPSLLPSPSS